MMDSERLAPGAVIAEGLAKRYHPQTRSSASLKECVIHALTRPWLRQTPPSSSAPASGSEVVALSDLTFTIRPGETIGVIGSNGSGKSTLLKLIAGIAQPTEGRLRVGGRVAALLELGAGFHPDLNGIENIFLMGAILGLPRAEIRRRLPEIVAFADIGPFIHTPIKHYSTGMGVRLGFAVAAHLEPDVVLLDEVISVGDADFQIKSLDRIRRLSAQGKTILLVSHQVESVERLCDRAIWLDGGTVRAMGPATEVLGLYRERRRPDAASMEIQATNWNLDFHSPTLRMGSGEVVIEAVDILNRDGRSTHRLAPGETMTIRLRYRRIRPVESLIAVLGFSREGVHFGLTESSDLFDIGALGSDGVFECRFDPMVMGGGSYFVNVMLAPRGRVDIPYDAHLRMYPIEVVDTWGRMLRPAVHQPARFRLI